MLISLKEYAEKNKVTYNYVRLLVSKGKIKPNTKIGQKWYIEESTPWFAGEHRLRKSDFDGKSMSNTRIHNIWRSMKQRCYNPKNTNYSCYGARGITVCDEWKNNSTAFIKWAFNSGYNDNLEIDRIDSEKGYSPDNCRWITRAENARRANLLIIMIKMEVKQCKDL